MDRNGYGKLQTFLSIYVCSRQDDGMQRLENTYPAVKMAS